MFTVGSIWGEVEFTVNGFPWVGLGMGDEKSQTDDSRIVKLNALEAKSYSP